MWYIPIHLLIGLVIFVYVLDTRDGDKDHWMMLGSMGLLWPMYLIVKMIRYYKENKKVNLKKDDIKISYFKDRAKYDDEDRYVE